MKPIITDHALVRWLERARGIDMTFLRSQLSDVAQPFAEARVKHAHVDGVWLVFDGPKLVTVTPDKPKPGQSARNDREDVNGTKTAWGAKRHWKHKMRKGGK